MGKSKETVVQQGSTNSSTQYTPTAEETAFNKIQLGQAQEYDPYQREINKNSANFINSLFTGNYSGLGAIFEPLARGTNEDVVSGMTSSSLRDLNAQLKKSGAGSFLESGASQSIGARTAGDIRQNAQQFDIGTILNLANLAVGGSAQVQQPALNITSQLGQRLAGLRGVTQNGSSTMNQSSYGQNPFLKSFSQSAGSSLGAGGFGNWKAF